MPVLFWKGELLMGLRDKIKNAVNRLSGEHSDATPDSAGSYSKPGARNDDAEVVMARLYRPGSARQAKLIKENESKK